ncbi:MAG: hypothetical protein J6M45_03705, partial [Pseudobutyrivibrio sp.]|nr:hypothetical protein [Pseudobutyrivibrio sp.]
MISKDVIEQYNLKLADRGLALIQTDEGLSLSSGELSIMADFRDMLPRLKKSNLEREMLVKAARIKGQPMPQTLVDATA